MGRRVATLERSFYHVRLDEPVEHEKVANDGSFLIIERVPGLEGELHGRRIEPDLLEACGGVIAESASQRIFHVSIQLILLSPEIHILAVLVSLRIRHVRQFSEELEE